MNPVRFDGAQTLGAPKGWDPARDGECVGLPVQIVASANGHYSYTSVWKFTDEDRAKIARGENLAITCFGAQVPIALSVAAIDGPIVEFQRDKAASRRG
jgi:hypothetical protein